MQHHYSTLLAIPNILSLPKVIFLDAVGTLFGVRGSVGEIYSQVAAKHGVDCDAQALDQSFYTTFKQANPCIFPGITAVKIPQYEYQWWYEINRQTFTAIDAWAKFSDFDRFFEDLYQYFTTASAWEIYPDVIPALTNWQRSGVPLGILSNFDSRLFAVLNALELNHYFSTVTISTEVSAAKPQPEIFSAALAKYQCPPELAWHIGDSYKEDYLGASSAGLMAIWLNRG
jgi:putative hydrolase of the HAD superfamily